MPDKKIQGEALFSFALVADTHIQSPHDRPSQWKTNNLAAERSRLAYEQMAATSPPFIVHLGDVTNPVPHAPTFDSACHAAKELIRTADTKTFIVAGNHDVGDKMSRIVPNHPIDDYSIRKFENHWGSSWQSWDYKDVHFLIINSSLVGSGLPQEREQLEFVESDLRDHSNKRTFLFSHYPLFMENPDEVSLYDNIEPKGRSALLKMLDQHHIEAAIAGHVHNFFYNTYGGTEMYGLLSTTFVRHDYAELFPTAPADEYGRNDTPKLAWAQITVFESGHALRTNRLLDPVVNYLDVHDLHPKQYTRSALGVNLRDAWAEAKPLMYMGPVDEFERRKVRNDYLLVALWETGIRHLRIPLRDLLRPDYVARIQDLVGIGHTFTAFVVDVPQGDLLEGLKRHESLLSGLEVILPWQEIDAHVPKIEALINIVDIPIYLACISSATDHRNKAYQFSYFMSYGFYADEIEMLKEAHERFGRRLGLAYAFRIGADESPVAAGTTIIQEFSEKEGIPVTINVASLSTIADLRDDEVAATTRAVETTLLGLLGGSREGTKVFLETLVDVEKGYNPSIGLYDALYNPRSGARATANLQMLLKDTPITIESVSSESRVRKYRVTHGSKSVVIMSPKSSQAVGGYEELIGRTAGTMDLTCRTTASDSIGPHPVIVFED